MNTFQDILNRTTLQQLSQLIRDTKITTLTYEQFNKKEETAYENLYKNLADILNHEQIYNIEPVINEYTSELCEIYFNMGMKTGARLIHQLLDYEDRD